MFSKKEREYLKHPDKFNPNYTNGLNKRIKKKIRDTINDLIFYVHLKSMFKTHKYDSEISSILDTIKNNCMMKTCNFDEIRDKIRGDQNSSL